MWCEECLRELKLAEELKKESKTELPCAKCEKLFTSLKLLNAHKKAVHEKVPCRECGKLFGMTNMIFHMKSAHTPDDRKKFQCDKCGKGFINKQHFSEHLNIHTGEKPYKCKFCPAAFAIKNSCAKHERLRFCDSKKEKHICNVCSWEFSTLKKLNKHKNDEHEKVPCADCGKLLGSGSLMINHNRSVDTPDDQKKFRCDTCDKAFISNQCLLEHINVHTEERPFKCTECIKSFVTKKLMKRHIQSAHTPEDQKKFRCDTCGKGFINNQRLSEHLNSHTGEKPFICKFCPAAFANSGTHAKHQRLEFCVLIFYSILSCFLSQEKTRAKSWTICKTSILE